MNASTAPFLTFEGIDGAGKSSRIAAAAALFRTPPLITREPGGTPLGERLREVLLHQPMRPMTEALLMFAARREHLETVILPALAAGRPVLCDRFSDASFAYQHGGRELPAAALEALEALTHPDFAPSLTFLFDLDPAAAAARLNNMGGERDRFEREQADFFARVRAAYLARAEREPARIVVLDAARTPADIDAEIATLLQQRFPTWLKT
ncbi:MAG: dTMP kinase [Rhodocyclaceae bacterium]|nr:dTMP kinase [Rhodocyclaceae bacterium]